MVHDRVDRFSLFIQRFDNGFILFADVYSQDADLADKRFHYSGILFSFFAVSSTMMLCRRATLATSPSC